MPLTIGARVTDLQGNNEGTLIDIDGPTAYVMQKNGVELEFAVDRLKPYQEAAPKTVRTQSGPNRDHALSPAHRALLASVPADLRAVIARSHDQESPTRPAFAVLPPDKQLETIRIYLPTLSARLLAPHLPLVVAFRSLPKPPR